MAKNSFYLIEEFNDWLYDIGKKRKMYDSYINTRDKKKRLSSAKVLSEAKRIVNSLLNDIDCEIGISNDETKKKTLQSKRSGLRSYKRFLSYIPTNYINYKYNGIKELAELFQTSNTSLIKYMISHSLFATPELVKKRAGEIANQIVNNEKIPARFSTGKKYIDVSNVGVKFKNRTDAYNKTKNSDYFYNENHIKVQTDQNGNKTICDYLAGNTSINITSRNPNRNCYGYMISHIWGRAIDPLYFSNFWNIVLIPQFVSFILDKSDEMACIKYAKDLYKAIAYVLYKESIDIINDALTKVGKNKLDIIEPDDDIEKDAKDIIKKRGIKFIP